jgi:hypothetical protein
MSMKKSSDTIGNRTRDLPVCSAVVLVRVSCENDKVQRKTELFVSVGVMIGRSGTGSMQ